MKTGRSKHKAVVDKQGKRGTMQDASMLALKVKAGSDAKKRKVEEEADELKSDDDAAEEEDGGDDSSSSSSSVHVAHSAIKDKIKKGSKTLEAACKTEQGIQGRIDAQNKVNEKRLKELANSRNSYPSDDGVSAVLIKNIGLFSELIFCLTTGAPHEKEILRGRC